MKSKRYAKKTAARSLISLYNEWHRLSVNSVCECNSESDSLIRLFKAAKRFPEIQFDGQAIEIGKWIVQQLPEYRIDNKLGIVPKDNFTF